MKKTHSVTGYKPNTALSVRLFNLTLWRQNLVKS